MDTEKEKSETYKRFQSIRIKFFTIYVGLLSCIVILILLILPLVMNRYLLRERMKDVDQIKKIVAEVLENEDFRVSEKAWNKIEGATSATGIAVWVVTPLEDNAVRVSVFGGFEGSEEPIDFSTFTLAEKALVKGVLNGTDMDMTRGAFPSAYSSSVISLGYQQAYQELQGFQLGETSGNFSMSKTGAVFLHISMESLHVTSRHFQQIVMIVLLLVAIAATAMTSMLGYNILEPVRKLKEAADAITKGDYTQEVEVRSNDEIGQLTDSFNKMAKELREVDTLQSDFIANISHDFRSPLTSIKGYVEAMLDGTIPPDMHEKYLQIVLDEANRLTKMTNNILDLTKMENGQIELNRTNFDINEMIINLALSLEQRVEEKKINMDFQFLQEKLYVNADLDLMQRVIYNLLDNALKFTSEGDTISVETSIVGKKAYIAVSDTGSGIDEQALPHIFDRFNKGDKSRGKNKMGTGLGLAIVKQIMLTHHEDIKVYSKVGEGTKFAFTLPLAYKYNLVEKK